MKRSNKRPLGWTVAASAIAVTLAAPAHAEDAPTAVAASEIVVTATRTANPLSKVPISVAAVTQLEMEKRGLKQIDDILRQTPGVALNKDDFGSSNISIRGVASNAGAATTGIYIDDVPLSVRQVGFSDGSMFPQLFDLDRVEVLKGPQGTLFGSGSEGGTVRFIQAQPDFDKWSGHSRIEVSGMEHGSPSYEGGVALGGPIIADKLAFRASAYYRRQGGTINAISGQLMLDPADLASADPVGSAAARGPYSALKVTNKQTIEKDSNWSTTTAARFALSAKPADNLVLTASVNYQYQKYNNNTSGVWTSLSNPASGDYNSFTFVQGSSSAILNDPNYPGNPGNGQKYLTDASMPLLNPAHDKSWTPYFNANWDVAGLNLVSTTSWQIRDHEMWQDTTTGYYWSYLGLPAPTYGEKASYHNVDKQRNFTQEFRIQNTNKDARLHWQAGLFYSNNSQSSIQDEPNNFMYLQPVLFGIDANSDPFPGTNAFLNAFGDYMQPNSVIYAAQLRTKEKQYAVFGQVDYKITPNLTLILGGRYSRNELTANLYTYGPESNTNAPYGSPCTTVGGCTVGSGEWAPSYAKGVIKNAQNSFTPKVSLSWQANNRNLFYGTVSKGFRPGGAQTKLPSACDAYYSQVGYTTSPTTYGSDEVMNYELGAKNKLFGGRLTLDSNIYRIKWKKIQTTITVPVCAYAFVDNAGEATSQGFDLSAAVKATRELSLSASVGYNEAKFDTSTALYRKGSYVPGTGSPLILNIAADYEHDLGAERSFYAHADWTYGSKPRLTGATDPGSPVYRAYTVPDPAYYLLAARVGVRFAKVDVSLFANNLANYKRPQGITYFQNSPLYTANYLQPRTFGLTASYRF